MNYEAVIAKNTKQTHFTDLQYFIDNLGIYPLFSGPGIIKTSNI